MGDIKCKMLIERIRERFGENFRNDNNECNTELDWSEENE